MVQIYKRKNYVIYSNHEKDSAYIVYNTRKEFSEGHTHINNYNTAKYIIGMSLNNLIPKKKLGDYVLQSIIRISTNKDYINKLEKLKKK